MTRHFQFRDRQLSMDRAHVMGILNVTPDSFSDGGLFNQREKAIEQAKRMAASGAAIVDIGGESTRPGAMPVSAAEELERVLPVVEVLAKECDVIISVDTSTPEVMSEAANNGAHLINDVRALQKPGALTAAAKTGLPVCLMHMQGQPATMQDKPSYKDVVTDISVFFEERIQACLKAGIQSEQILLDPGFGFGKSLEHNLRLVKHLKQLAVQQLPLLVGMSRKSMIGAVLDKPAEQRLAGTVALTAAAVLNGAFIVRVHDVEENADAVRMINAVMAS